MNELDAPATKRDLLELATQRDLLALRDDLRHEIEKLGVKIEALGPRVPTSRVWRLGCWPSASSRSSPLPWA